MSARSSWQMPILLTWMCEVPDRNCCRWLKRLLIASGSTQRGGREKVPPMGKRCRLPRFPFRSGPMSQFTTHQHC